MNIYKCQFCDRETTNAGANKAHENRCKLNPDPVPLNKPRRPPGYKGENQYTKAKRLGLPKPERSEETISKIRKASIGRRHTEETKNKISKARQKYLAENPDKVPYKLNHYSKGRSYPEQFWKEIFDNHGVQYSEQYKIHTYQLDFALVDQKIDIEIDGEQHYLDERIIQSDKRRNKYLEELGWKIIRIRWSDYKKLIDEKDRINYVNSIIKEITDR